MSVIKEVHCWLRFRRGKPLHLSEERYRLLEQLWTSHSFDHACKQWQLHTDRLWHSLVPIFLLTRVCHQWYVIQFCDHCLLYALVAVSTLLIEVTAYLFNLLFSCYELVQIWNGVTLLLWQGFYCYVALFCSSRMIHYNHAALLLYSIQYYS